MGQQGRSQERRDIESILGYHSRNGLSFPLLIYGKYLPVVAIHLSTKKEKMNQGQNKLAPHNYASHMSDKNHVFFFVLYQNLIYFK